MLAQAEADDLLRTPLAYESHGSSLAHEGHSLVSFASNDYLGLANHRELRQALALGAERCAGPGSSRVVAGTCLAHREAEAALAAHVHLPAARLFSSAYAANLGLLGSLFGPGDLLLSDSLNHASLIDGCRLSRAHVKVFRHGDMDHLGELLRAHRSSASVAAVVTETAFSMDGDVADVGKLRRIASEHACALVVDEAHALGIMGPRGVGVCGQAGVRPDVLVGGLGKAFGLVGGFVAGSTSLARALDNFGRTFVFSTAILPAIACAVPTSVHLVQQAVSERALLHAHANTLRDAVRLAGCGSGQPPAVIVPVLLGSPDRAMQATARLRARGFLVPAMRPPTVPVGTSRLRITPSALHTQAEVTALCLALADAVRP